MAKLHTFQLVHSTIQNALYWKKVSKTEISGQNAPQSQANLVITFPDNLSIIVTDHCFVVCDQWSMIIVCFCLFVLHFLVLKSSHWILVFESEMTGKRDNNQIFSPSVVNFGHSCGFSYLLYLY